jgi:hypothetical protein
VRGLLCTGRARPRRLGDTGRDVAEFIRLERHAAHGATYWIRRDGSELRTCLSFAGDDLERIVVAMGETRRAMIGRHILARFFVR